MVEYKHLMMINHNTPCSCSCRYCFFQSKKTSYGVPYVVGEKIAMKFDQWRKNEKLADLSLSYAISHCADYPELLDNIKLNKELGFIGYSFLQINGIQMRDSDAIKMYLEEVKEAGVQSVDTTFYGMREYHDRFAARKGDFDFLLSIVRMGISVGLDIQPSVAVFEDNKEQLAELIDVLQSLGCKEIHCFIHDYRGNGIAIDSNRLSMESYSGLHESVKGNMSMRNHKTESDWVIDNQFAPIAARELILALRPDNIDRIEAMSCDEIIEYLLDIDHQYYSAMPDIQALAKTYGDTANTKLYRQRDLWWKWTRAHIREKKLELPDVTDQRNCGAMRY